MLRGKVARKVAKCSLPRLLYADMCTMINPYNKVWSIFPSNMQALTFAIYNLNF